MIENSRHRNFARLKHESATAISMIAQRTYANDEFAELPIERLPVEVVLLVTETYVGQIINSTLGWPGEVGYRHHTDFGPF